MDTVYVTRLVVGLAMTVAALAVSGRRAFWLYRLIRSGQPADDRREHLVSPEKTVTAKPEIVSAADWEQARAELPGRSRTRRRTAPASPPTSADAQA